MPLRLLSLMPLRHAIIFFFFFFFFVSLIHTAALITAAFAAALPSSFSPRFADDIDAARCRSYSMPRYAERDVSYHAAFRYATRHMLLIRVIDDDTIARCLSPIFLPLMPADVFFTPLIFAMLTLMRITFAARHYTAKRYAMPIFRQRVYNRHHWFASRRMFQRQHIPLIRCRRHASGCH